MTHQLDLGSQRDAVAGQMQALLTGAEFNHQGVDADEAQSLTRVGEEVLKRALPTVEFCTS